MIKQVLRNSLILMLFGPLIAWSTLALWLDSGAAPAVAASLAAGFAFAALLILWRMRPFYRGAGLVLGMFLGVLLWWWQIKPSNTRNWSPEVAQLPSAEINGDQVILNNVRNFEYASESEFTPRWERRNLDLSGIRGADLFLSYWGSPLIAHTIVSWEFADGTHLAISIETRKEQGEEYSALRGFFRQYELYYVVADERDVIRLRSNFRNETVYLYRIKEQPQFARALLLNYLQEVNRLAVQPKWYNAFSHNCTTNIRHHRQNIGRANPWDWRILVNGYIDQLGYENGTIDNDRPFAEIKRRAMINERARLAGVAPDFSSRIRVD